MSNPTQYTATNEVESDYNIIPKAIEQDTAKNEDRGNQSTGGMKKTYSEEADQKSQGNIAEEANDKESNPKTSRSPVGHFHQTVIQSKTENKHIVHDYSFRQKVTESNEWSSVDQFTQNTGEKVFDSFNQSLIFA